MVFGTKTYATGDRGYRVYKNELKGKKRFSCVILHFLVQSLVLVVLVVLLPPQAVVHTGKKVFSLEKQQQQPRKFSSFNFFLDFQFLSRLSRFFLQENSQYYAAISPNNISVVFANYFFFSSSRELERIHKTSRRKGTQRESSTFFTFSTAQKYHTVNSRVSFIVIFLC